MRTLEKNKIAIWYVNSTTYTDETDDDGFYTGEKVPVFGTPTKVYINLYPSNSEIVGQIFGKDSSFDMIACSMDIVFENDTLIFLTEPSLNYDTTYDYFVDKISKSLNVYQYGLRKRT